MATVDDLAHVRARTFADGELGAAAAVDELARVRARTFADGELGAATAVVLVIKLGRNCN